MTPIKMNSYKLHQENIKFFLSVLAEECKENDFFLNKRPTTTWIIQFVLYFNEQIEHNHRKKRKGAVIQNELKMYFLNYKRDYKIKVKKTRNT